MKLTLRRPDPALVIPLETDRFILRPMRLLETLRVTAGWRRDPEIVTGLYHSSRPRSLFEWLDNGPMPNNVDRFTYAVVDKASGRVIGFHAVRYCNYRTAKLTVALRDRSFWGKNVVAEIRPRLINHFFRHAPVDRFIGHLNGRNAASLFNYRRLGFDHVGTFHRHVRNPVTGEVYDLMMFELLREKWLTSPLADSALRQMEPIDDPR